MNLLVEEVRMAAPAIGGLLPSTMSILLGEKKARELFEDMQHSLPLRRWLKEAKTK